MGGSVSAAHGGYIRRAGAPRGASNGPANSQARDARKGVLPSHSGSVLSGRNSAPSDGEGRGRRPLEITVPVETIRAELETFATVMLVEQREGYGLFGPVDSPLPMAIWRWSSACALLPPTGSTRRLS